MYGKYQDAIQKPVFILHATAWWQICWSERMHVIHKIQNTIIHCMDISSNYFKNNCWRCVSKNKQQQHFKPYITVDNHKKYLLTLDVQPG